MSPIRPCFVLLLGLFLVPGLRAVETVGPEATPLAESGVPMLHEVQPEHRLSGAGLVLEPEDGPYEWTRIAPDPRPFRLRVAVAAPYERAVLTLWNWQNHAVRQWHLGSGAERHVELAVKGLGCYLLTLDGWKEGVPQGRLIRNLGVTRDLNRVRDEWRTDQFFVGICAFPGRYHWRPGGEPTLPAGLTEDEARHREAALIARLGLQVVRTDESLEMGRRQTRDGGSEYYFDAKRMDAAVEAYTSRGFQLALQTMNAADWAVLPAYSDQGRDRWRYPHQEEPQRAYLAELVRRYGPRARFVQIGNEPDQIGYWAGTPEEFVHQFRYSIDEVRRAAPGLPVANGGYSLVDEAKCAYFVKELHDLVDLPAYNAHGNLADYKRSFATMRRFQEEAGDSKTGWINTETGYSAWRLEQERRQAQVDAQKVLYSWANDHAGLLLFCSRMTRGPGRDGPPDFGLLDYQFGPRFAYGALAALMEVLSGAVHERTLLEDETRHLYLFQRQGERILAGFQTGEGVGSRVRVDHDAGEVIALDAMGNTTGLGAATGLEIGLSDYPHYWRFPDATRVELAPEIRSPD